jgi:hypothetical protein
MEKVSFNVFREHGSELCTCRQLITGVNKIMCNNFVGCIPSFCWIIKRKDLLISLVDIAHTK